MDEAFRVLDQIARGAQISSADEARWIHALATIGWVSQSGDEVVLTAEGLQAHRDLARTQADARRRSRSLQPVD